MTLPAAMRAIVLSDYGSPDAVLAVQERPVPQPGPGEVLVRVAASPVNPSDLDFIEGRYGFKKPVPVVPGFEGSGTVVQVGAGLLPWMRRGKRVSCAVQQVGDGCWAQYVVVSAMNCLPLPSWLDDEQGATMLVNPFSCYAMIAHAKELGTKGFVQTAAGGVLGQMLFRFGRREGLSVINVVRRTEQATALTEAGMSHVLCSEAPGFEDELSKLCRELGVRVAFDAVGGESTAKLCAALPIASTVFVYGQLANEPCRVASTDVIFRDTTVRGFWLSAWLARRSVPSTLWAWERVKGFVREEMRTEVRSRQGLDEFLGAVSEYRKQMSGGKVLLTPNA